MRDGCLSGWSSRSVVVTQKTQGQMTPWTRPRTRSSSCDNICTTGKNVKINQQQNLCTKLSALTELNALVVWLSDSCNLSIQEAEAQGVHVFKESWDNRERAYLLDKGNEHSKL